MRTPHFLAGDTTIPAATLFELIVRLSAYEELFAHVEYDAQPAVGNDDRAFAYGLYRTLVGGFPGEWAVSSDAYESCPQIVEYEAAIMERAAVLLRQAREASHCAFSTLTDKGFRALARELELLAFNRRRGEATAAGGRDAS